MATVSHTMESAPKSTETLTELLWQDALRLLKATNNEVLLPTNVRDMIGQGNVNKIKTRLSALLGAPVVGFIDESIDAFRLMRTPAFSGTTVSVASHDLMTKLPLKGPAKALMATDEKSRITSKGSKIPRPPNAFILYRQHYHPKIKEAYPDFQNNDISIMLGKQWKSEPDEVRAHYKALADEQKQKHAEEHPDYQYTPRRPCERKRRASSRQYAKHSKAAAAAGVAAAGANRVEVQNKAVAESPTSMTSATTFSSVPTPGSVHTVGSDMMTPMSSNMNVYLGPSDLQDEQFHFDTSAFDLMVQELRNSQNQELMMQSMSPPEQTAVNSFDFSDYITDSF